MQQRSMLIVAGIFLLSAFACNQADQKKNNHDLHEKEKATEESVSGVVKKLNRQAGSPSDWGIQQRRFIYSGSVEFETDSTLATTKAIEDVVNASGGVVLQSHVQMNEQKTVTTPVNTDSVKKLLYYKLCNEMVVRVPDTFLHRFLQQVAPYSRFTVSRNITAEDVSVKWLSGSLEQNRLDEQAGRRQEQLGKMKGETELTATDALDAREEHRDASLMNQVQLADNIRYSEVRLNFYQPLQLQVQYLVNDDADWAKGPGFFKRAGYAFAAGWAKCKELLLFFLSIWWLAVIFLLLWMGYKKWGRKLVMTKQP